MTSVTGSKGIRPDLTVHRLLSERAERTPDAPAVAALAGAPLTYCGLRDHVERVVVWLNALGIGRSDRVAVVLPNGPEMAVAFFAVAAAATCAPLNPTYRAKEFDFYLSDLQAKALIILSGMESPARDVARARDIPLLELVPAGEKGAGLFTLTGGEVGTSPARPGLAQTDDVALVLHTSGTTSQPKIVPLTQGNLCASALNIKQSLQLTEEDGCLNIMPLFHIHGLIGATFSSLAAGGRVVCTPGLDASRFFGWLEGFRPTWYTAVPTMHQAILGRAADNREVISRFPLRLLRSCSSALPPQLMAALEQAFHAPVIEAYGMTEASHQMASNPLPPASRKPGSVGKGTGTDVAIMNAEGQLLPAGQTGEVVIRGPGVTNGYENNSEANQQAFTNGWFRTGDQGHQDDEGYLFLTGRIKELINRGGEKISPREVDEVLLDHPAVAQALTFAVPHATLGEDVAAAVVLRAEASTTDKELREFAAARLADFKVPRQVLLLPEIPKGPTGKPQRIGLAEKLGLTTAARTGGDDAFAAPRTPTEEMLAAIWAELLQLPKVGIYDDFFQIGGNSLLAATMVVRIQKRVGQYLPLASLIGVSTIEHLGRILDQRLASTASLVLMQPDGPHPPFFCVHGVGGEILTLVDLARHMGPDQPFYGLQMQRSSEGEPELHSIQDMAAHYLEEICAFQPEGPYFLGGISFGGSVAFEMAQQLVARGQQVGLLAILDHVVPGKTSGPAFWTPRFVAGYLANCYNWVRYDLLESNFSQLWGRTQRKLWALTKQVGKVFGRRGSASLGADVVEEVFDTSRLPDVFRRGLEVHYQAWLNYVPSPYPGRISLIRACAQSLSRAPRHDLGWGKLTAGGVDVTVIPGNHATILTEPYVRNLAEQLKVQIRKAQTLEGTRPIPANDPVALTSQA
jgi:acyl-CoA synthetase (AMP-forming)/AMP-acid ligase II/thioesterase domain-containing protein